MGTLLCWENMQEQNVLLYMILLVLSSRTRFILRYVFCQCFSKKKKKHKHSYVMLMTTRVFFFIFLFFSICMRYTHFFFTSACSNDAYGSDCEYTCGQCFNNASCERNNGTCSNGCEKGHTGSDCKQRKCFKIFYKCMKKKTYHRIFLHKIYFRNVFIDWC